jgi:uncharacterized protein YjbI with pentapeptide repeats
VLNDSSFEGIEFKNAKMSNSDLKKADLSCAVLNRGDYEFC